MEEENNYNKWAPQFLLNTTNDPTFLKDYRKCTTGFHYFITTIYSNWYMSPFWIDEKQFNCNEQYYMAMKAKYFDDHETYFRIMDSNDPSEQKYLGRQIKNFNKDQWDKTSTYYMFTGCLNKFLQNTRLRKELVLTFPKCFVECNPKDAIWGNGLTVNDSKETDPLKWVGKNKLGLVLNAVRTHISTQLRTTAYLDDNVALTHTL